MLPREKIEAEIAYLEIVGRKDGRQRHVATSPKPASTTVILHAQPDCTSGRREAEEDWRVARPWRSWR
jgi:hypothetical protein